MNPRIVIGHVLSSAILNESINDNVLAGHIFNEYNYEVTLAH